MPQHHGKRFKALTENYDRRRLFSAPEAIAIVRKNANAKFNETVEAHVRLGVDPKNPIAIKSAN